MEIIPQTAPSGARRRSWSLVVTAVFALAALGWFWGTRIAPSGLHSHMELSSALLAAVVSALSISRFMSRGETEFLFVGTGFAGTGFFDTYHLAVSLATSDLLMDASAAGLVPQTWLASRTFLALMMCASLYYANSERKDRNRRPSYLHAWALTWVLALGVFVVFNISTLPEWMYPSQRIARPLELIPGLLFLGAWIYEIRSQQWRTDTFRYHIAVFLFISALGQIGAMAFSGEYHDGLFWAGHAFKIAGYGYVLMGLLLEIGRSFREADEARIVKEFNETLSRRVMEMTGNLVRQNNELITLNADLAHSRDQAQAANLAKSRFLAMMSHELRTPLTAILGYTEILQEDAEEEQAESRLQDLNRIWTAGDHLLHIINDVLDLSRIESGRLMLNREHFDMGKLIHATIDQVRPAIEAQSNRLHIQIPDTLPWMQSDRVRIQQGLLNLLSNAAKFCEHGLVSVTAAHEVRGEDDWITVSVSDTGIGMTPEQIERIFNDFEQADSSTSRRFGGTGLGLSITRRLMALLGGTIAVDSQEGRGTTFRFALPVHAPEAPILPDSKPKQ